MRHPLVLGFGVKNLKKLLHIRRLTQAWLARELGVNEVSVSRWVHGDRYPDRSTRQRIANLLQCEVEEITGEINILTVEERRALDAFRSIPTSNRAAFWAVISALTQKDNQKPDDQNPSTLTDSAKKTS